MRSWLANPVVALIGFLASVLALVQWICAVTRSAVKLLKAADAHRRAPMLAVMVGFTAIAVISPLSWTAILIEATKANFHGWMDTLYPFMLNGSSLAGCLMLLEDARAGRRLNLWACTLLIGALVFAATIYVVHNNAMGWDKYLTAAVPGVVIALLVPVWISHAGNGRSPAGAGTR